MKFLPILTGLVAAQVISAASIPEPNALHVLEERRVVPPSELLSPEHTLERRKGGGGRGGGSSSGGGRSGGGGGAPGRTSPTSNAGGATSAGSGRPRSFAGGRYYGGGAATPYTAGSRTPKGLIAGALILPATMLLIMPGLWLYSTYPYYYNNPYRFYNQSATNDDDDNDNSNDRRALWTRQTQGRNESLPVMCVCEEDFVCGCDENDDQQYINDLVGNGSYAALNKTLVTVSEVNGTKTLVLNGTLEKGTTAPGGSDDDDSAAVNLKVGKYAGYYAVGMMVLAGVFM